MDLNLPVPKIPAPQIPAPTVNTDINLGLPKSINTSVQDITKNVPSVNAPDLRSTLTQTNIPTSVSGISSAFGGPTSLADGLKPELPNISANINLPKITFPKVTNFPGLDQAGITLGAGPKFMAETIAKYKTIVPPFAPGLKLNMAMIGGAVAIIKTLSSGNPAALLQQITKNFADDIKAQAGAALNASVDTSGIDNIKDQVQGLEQSVTTAAENIQSATTNTTGDVISQVSNTAMEGAKDKINAFGFPPSG